MFSLAYILLSIAQLAQHCLALVSIAYAVAYATACLLFYLSSLSGSLGLKVFQSCSLGAFSFVHYYTYEELAHTANIFTAKTTGFHCVTNPTAVSLHFLQTTHCKYFFAVFTFNICIVCL